jgi:hypothetical protein
MARLTSVIEPLPLLSTDPLVLRASVWTPVGARAAVTFMFPEFEPFKAPIRKVPADTRFTSALVRERRSETSVPKSITVLLDCGAIVTTPADDVVPMVAPSASLFAVNEIAEAAETLLSKVTVAPVEVIDTEPDEEAMSALVAVVMFPDPEIKMLPEACKAPVGAIEVPPLMVKFPAELRDPVPVYPWDGVMTIFPALEVEGE